MHRLGDLEAKGVAEEPEVPGKELRHQQGDDADEEAGHDDR